MRIYLIILFSLLLGRNAMAQFERGSFLVPAVLIGKDTVPYIKLPTVEIVAESKLTTEELAAIQQYNKLKRHVYKVYPYARFAAAKYKEISDKSRAFSDRERKKFIKAEEKKAKEQFEGELKQLTFTQGRILIKLVDRETGQSSYNLVKELKGGFNAFMWQGLARIFGENLKWRYDSLGEDKAIEKIVRELETNARAAQQKK